MSRFAGVIFDCDGVLVDTEPAWAAATQELGEAYGVELDARELRGCSAQQIAEAMCRELRSPPAVAELTGELVALLAHMTFDARPLAGAHRLVARVSRRQLTAVASNGPRPIVEQVLERAGLEFDLLVTADDVVAPKPEPDVYLYACARLALAPETAVALEDSERGAAAARAAGLYVVGVGSQLASADLTVAGLDDPALLELFPG